MSDFVALQQSDELLRQSVQRIANGDQLDLDQIPGLELQPERAEDARRFGNAVNYVGGPGTDISVLQSRLDQTASNIEKLDPSIADYTRRISGSMFEPVDGLDSKLLQAKGAEYESRLSEFVSAVKDQLDRMSNIALELSKKPDVSQADLMKIQFEVMQMSIVLDVASKVGDKGSQALQTLFRDK